MKLHEKIELNNWTGEEWCDNLNELENEYEHIIWEMQEIIAMSNYCEGTEKKSLMYNLVGNIGDRTSDLLQHILFCTDNGGDSFTPIESLYYNCFNYFLKYLKIKKGELYLIPQTEIETENGIYRVDFYLVNNLQNNNKKYVIECDGHDFHSSKEQIAKDNQRQRDIENCGYNFIRFSGSEIYNNPIKCVYETFKKLNIDEKLLGGNNDL